MSKKNKGKQHTCPYCSKPVTLTPKGGLPPHLGPGAIRCIGVGIVVHKDHLRAATK